MVVVLSKFMPQSCLCSSVAEMYLRGEVGKGKSPKREKKRKQKKKKEGKKKRKRRSVSRERNTEHYFTRQKSIE